MTIHYHSLKKPNLQALNSASIPTIPYHPHHPGLVQVCRWMGSMASVVEWTNPGRDLPGEALAALTKFSRREEFTKVNI